MKLIALTTPGAEATGLSGHSPSGCRDTPFSPDCLSPHILKPIALTTPGAEATGLSG
ncbi:MAG: hypothetical protein IT323_14945 [Anaerolineae bacterium]|nr:hypothetical protein [Anaerolineae bacterium]